LERLAELGIDPEGMASSDILRLFYARGANTSYKSANKEAEMSLNVRPSTPRSFGGVLTNRAHQEVRRARDMPVTNVHECLDKWEIDTLADVCRSIRHYDDESRGSASEYQRSYSRRHYGGRADRKSMIRQPI